MSGPSTIRRSEPPRRSTRYRSQVTQSTDNSGAEDLPYLPTAPVAADPPSAFRRARSAQSVRAHRKTASFSRIVNLDVEVDVESALNRTGQSRRSRDGVEEEARSERTERSVRQRYSSTVYNDLTPRGGSSKKRKYQVRQSLGVSQVLGEMTLDRRAEMVSDVARDCLVKLLAISRKGGGGEARKAWDSLQILRHTYMFSKHAPPFADLHSFVSALHPGNAYNPLVLSHALDLSNICTFIYTILFPDEAAELLKDMDPYFLDDIEGNRSGSGKGKGKEERLGAQVEDSVKRRNQLLLMAWKKFWVVVIPREMKGSDSALKLWLDFATMIIRTWQSPSIFPISPPNSSLPELPETVLTDLLSPSAVTRFGQWELSDDLDSSDIDATDQADHDDSERSAVIRRWRDLVKRRKQVLAERPSEVLLRQFDWSRFTGELCAFVRIELADGGYLPTGVNVKRAESEISVKRRLSSNTSNPTPSRYSLTLPRRTAEELTGEDEDDVDMETADSALEESEADDGIYDLPKLAEVVDYVDDQGDMVDFDMLKDLAMEMDEEAEDLAQNVRMKRDRIPSGHRSTLSPKKRTSTASPRKSRSSLPIMREEDGYTADVDTLRSDRATQMVRQVSRWSKHSTSPVRPDNEEWAIRDMLPPPPGQASASGAAGPSRPAFNFAARQNDAERVDWDSQTPVRREKSGRALRGEVIQRDYAEDRDHTPRPRGQNSRLSPDRAGASIVPDLAVDPAIAADMHTPKRNIRDPTQEFVATPGIFHEEQEAEEIEVLENIGLTDDRPVERVSEAPIAARVPAVPELARPVDGGVSVSSEMIRTPSQDIDDILPDPALLRLQPGPTVSREVSRAPGPVARSSKRPTRLVEEDESEGEDEVVYIERPAQPTAQGPYISSRPRSSTRPSDFAVPTAEEEEADRRLLSHPATPRHRQSTTTTDIKPMRDPDFLIAPGLRRQTNQRAPSRAPFARIHSVQPAEPDLDPYLYDEDGQPLAEDEEYVLPLDYSPERSMLHGPTGRQSSSYSRISGKRKWTKPEEILLYRTVQKVPLSEEYPLRVVWYLHGEFGVLTKTLADFNPQHMKDKMRVIVSARYNKRKPVLARARFWLATGHPDKEALAEEMAEWKARARAERLAENERIRLAQAKAKGMKKGRKSRSRKRAREEEETEEDELDSDLESEGEDGKGDEESGAEREGVPETADEGEAADQDGGLEELGTPTPQPRTPSKRRSGTISTPNKKQTPKRGRGRPRNSNAATPRKSYAKTITSPQVSKRTGPSDRQKRAEARAEAARQAAGDLPDQQAEEEQGSQAEADVGDGTDEHAAGDQAQIGADGTDAQDADAQDADGHQEEEDDGEHDVQDENGVDNAARPLNVESHIEEAATVRATRSRSRTTSRPPAPVTLGSMSNTPAQPVRRMRSVRGRGRGRGGVSRLSSEGSRKARSSTCEVVLESRRPTELVPVQEDAESEDLGRSQEEVDDVEDLKVVGPGSDSDSGGEDEDEEGEEGDDASSPDRQQADGEAEEGAVEGQEDTVGQGGEGETFADAERVRMEYIKGLVMGQQKAEGRSGR